MNTKPIAKVKAAAKLNTLADLPGGDAEVKVDAGIATAAEGEVNEEKEEKKPVLNTPEADTGGLPHAGDDRGANGENKIVTKSEARGRAANSIYTFNGEKGNSLPLGPMLKIVSALKNMKLTVEETAALPPAEAVANMTKAIADGSFAKAVAEGTVTEFVQSLSERDLSATKTVAEWIKEEGYYFAPKVGRGKIKEFYDGLFESAVGKLEIAARKGVTNAENDIITQLWEAQQKALTDAKAVAEVAVEAAAE